MNKNICYLLLIIVFIFSSDLSLAGSDAKQGGSVKIIEIEPSLYTPLRVGSEVLFKVKIEYEIKDDPRAIKLIIQKRKDLDSGRINSTGIGNTEEVLIHGKGQVILEKEIKIPDANAVEIVIIVKIPGQVQGLRAHMESYNVIK